MAGIFYKRMQGGGLEGNQEIAAHIYVHPMVLVPLLQIQILQLQFHEFKGPMYEINTQFPSFLPNSMQSKYILYSMIYMHGYCAITIH